MALIDDLHQRTTAMLTQFPDAGARFRGEMRFVTVRRYSLVYRHDVGAGAGLAVRGYKSRPTQAVR